MKRLIGVLVLLALITATIFWLASIDISGLSKRKGAGQAASADKRLPDMQSSMLLSPGPDALKLISKRYEDISVKSVPSVVQIRSIQAGNGQSLIVDSQAIADYYSGLGIEVESVGTGVFLNDQGLILTPLHVVLSAAALQVRTWDGKVYQAELVSADVGTDLAILKIPLSGTRAIKWGDSSFLGLGEFLVLVGSDSRMNGRICQGLVSSSSYMPLVLDESYFGQYFLIDAGSASPRSGWLVLNLDGEMVGILAQSAARIYKSQGEYVALSSNQIREVTDLLSQGKVVIRSYAGLHIQQLTMDLGSVRPAKVPMGALVADVVPGSPAEQAGLLPGDVLLKIGPTVISHYGQVRPLIAALPSGGEVSFQVDRAGGNLTLSLTPVPHPIQLVVTRNNDIPMRNVSDSAKVSPLDGISVEEMPDQPGTPRGSVLPKRLAIASVDYLQVVPSVPLEPGSRVLEVDGQILNGKNDFEAMKEKTQGRAVVVLRIDSLGVKRYITLRSVF